MTLLHRLQVVMALVAAMSCVCGAQSVVPSPPVLGYTATNGIYKTVHALPHGFASVQHTPLPVTVSVYESSSWSPTLPYHSFSQPTRVISINTSMSIPSFTCTFVITSGATFALVCSNSIHGRTFEGKVLYDTAFPGNFTLSNQPVLNNGFLFIGSKSTTLNYPSSFFALDAIQGSLYWTFNSRGHCDKASVVTSTGSVVFGATWLNELSDMQHQLISVDAATGVASWKQDNMPSATVNISQFSPAALIATGVTSAGYVNFTVASQFPLYISSSNLLLLTTSSYLVVVNASTLTVISTVQVSQNIGAYVRYNDTTGLLSTSNGIRQVTVNANGTVTHFILGSSSAASFVLCGGYIVGPGASDVRGFVIDSPSVIGWMAASWGGVSGSCYISTVFGPVLLLTTNGGVIFLSGSPTPQAGVQKQRQNSLSNVVSSGSTVVVSDSTNLYAFSLSSKKAAWEVTSIQGTVNLLEVHASGIVAVYQPFYQTITGYSTLTGNLTGTSPYLSNAIANNNLMLSLGTDLFFSGSQSLWEFDSVSMKPTRRIVYTQTYTQTFALPDLDGVHIFVVNPVNITKYKKHTDYNEVIWQIAVPDGCPSGAPLLQLGTIPGSIFMVCFPTIVSFSNDNGTTLWQTEFSTSVAATKLSPCPSGSPVLCIYATHTSRIRVYNAVTGTTIQTFGPGSGSFVNVVSAGPSTIVALTSSNLYAYSPENGQVWSLSILNSLYYSNPTLLTASSDAKYIYAVGSFGTSTPAGVVVVELSSGMIHSVVQVPQSIFPAAGLPNTMGLKSLRANVADKVDTIFATGFGTQSTTSYVMVNQPTF